ncbi:ankyrin repeat domain-containing protein [Flavobacterium rhizosphaerae]|uniref:Ankyrin repeat domain-containing protein n=1 Tax=Flavobacterium rhizosphaerae TaxID=3163298 RepID=A0ABW8YY71_9FLAO
MKKTIIYLSLALVAFCNVNLATASTGNLEFGLVKEYKTATPLAVAIAKGDIEAVKKFIEYGVDVNESSNGMTPLMVAARYNQAEIINLLVENGANLKTTDSNGFSALKYAQLSNAEKAVKTIEALEA